MSLRKNILVEAEGLRFIIHNCSLIVCLGTCPRDFSVSPNCINLFTGCSLCRWWDNSHPPWQLSGLLSVRESAPIKRAATSLTVIEVADNPQKKTRIM